MRIERLILIVVGIALLRAGWKLYRGRGKHWWKRTKDQVPRHWRAKSPDDCPRCQVEPVPAVVVVPTQKPPPYPERKSRRGRKPQLDTEGWACPNEACVYFGETDARRHALIGYGKIGQDKSMQRLMCAVCEATFSCRKGTPLYYAKTDPAAIAEALWWLAEGVDISVLVRKTGYHEETLTQWLNRAGVQSARLAVHARKV